jgi:LacI family transcriptional regulator
MGYSVDVYSPLKNISFQKEQLRIAGWLSSLPKPVGILACNDDRGQHVLEACKLADINVPEDVAVLGVDNDTLICDLCDPPLSSVSLGTIQAGFEASKLLDRLMNGEKMNGQIISVPATHIVKRQSTDILAINDKNIVNALLYIKANFKEKIKVDEVVKATALGRRNLERKFKKVLGRSILEEITRARIEHISKLLIETDLRISEIMSTVNFSEIQHLSRYFRKEKSMSMRDFRNNMKNIKELV